VRSWAIPTQAEASRKDLILAANGGLLLSMIRMILGAHPDQTLGPSAALLFP
jgi:hypothetical protein